jgi:ATP-binding cassette, subfamily B, bacterial MsbA
MNTYLRILSFARPFGFKIPLYFLYTLIYVVFGMVNFAALIPLLQVIFKKVDTENLPVIDSLPSFELSVDYFTTVFNYYNNHIISNYGLFGALQFVCVLIICSVFISNLFGYLGSKLIARIRANAITNLRNKIFENLTHLHLGYFTNERKGDITSRITNDVQQVEHTVVDTLKVVVKEPLLIVGHFVFLFYVSPMLTLYTLLLLPISGGIIARIVKKLKRSAKMSQASIGRLTSFVDETLGGIRLIKAFTARGYVRKKFDEEVRRYAKINISMAKKVDLASPVSEFFGAIAIAVILLIGGSLILGDSSELTAEQFIAFIIVFGRVLQPAKAISNSISNIQRGLASGDRIFEIVDTVSKIQEKPNAIEMPEFKDKIEFRNVSFAYNSESVLKNIQLTIEKGKTIALVGPSGGGKSTLADLVPRFYDPVEGSVTIDGTDLRDCTLDSFRKQMGIVAQESILFNDSVFNNIAFGMENAREEDVIRAAKIANAHDFIIELEEGYHTNIGERGSKLSGGQRQRISIARAVMKNPAILILDEATSALDSESERLVQEALTNLMKNRTSIVIAHRLSTIQHADEILVIQAGEIVERGTHKDLLAANGVYARLTSMQNL